MFQTYHNFDSNSEQATVNGWCQRISVAEIKAALKEEKKVNWFKRLLKRVKLWN